MKAEDLKQRLEAGEKIEIYDVREGDEYAASAAKIDGAKNVPMGRMFIEANKGNLPKDRKIVAVCLKGTRCEIVARELGKQGYDIEHLEGGIEAWHKPGA